MSEHPGRSGILLIDKPAGLTSHDVVSRIRRAAGTRKVGHAGTLDPMATGLLVLGLNSATRLLTFLVGLDKEYLATIRLGASSSTDDAEGELHEKAAPESVAAITRQAILDGMRSLTGSIEQVPSAVSAIKVDGQRAYARVRAGETVELKPRAVTVSAFELLAVREAEYLEVDVRVECSSGTYIRALARDLGTFLGVGGHLGALRRTRVGPLQVADASDLTDVEVKAALLSPASVASALFPSVSLDSAQALDLSHGKRIRVAGLEDGSPIAALAPDGTLLGLVEVASGAARTLINFPADAVREDVAAAENPEGTP